jgi:processing peptidase subunit alpha
MRKVDFGKALRRYPLPRHASTLPLNPSVRVTTLSNKIRVATENTPGHFSSVGLYIDAGARYETSSNLGVSHFLDRMAFKVRSTCSEQTIN